MSWQVLISARTFGVVGQAAVERLKANGCRVTVPSPFGPFPAEKLLELLPGQDAVLASPDAYSAAVLRSSEARQLKIISRWGVGFDSIDIAAATSAGIVVAYTPGMLNEAVADYTFALLLAVARRVPEVHQTMLQGQWKVYWGCDVATKTIGIIGCGRIGQAVARRAKGFGMKLLGYDVAPSRAAEAIGVRFVSLDTLLQQSDFVSIHAALTPENHGLIGEAQLRRMKPAAYLVNTARGAHVDEEALLRALQEHWIAGAALDAFLQEPMASDHPFRTAPNLLLSPHQAPAARETGERVSQAACEAVLDLMKGERPRMVVNPEVLESNRLRAKLKGPG